MRAHTQQHIHSRSKVDPKIQDTFHIDQFLVNSRVNFSSEMSQEKRSGLEIISSFIRITWDKSNIKRVIISGIEGVQCNNSRVSRCSIVRKKVWSKKSDSDLKLSDKFQFRGKDAKSEKSKQSLSKPRIPLQNCGSAVSPNFYKCFDWSPYDIEKPSSKHYQI